MEILLPQEFSVEKVDEFRKLITGYLDRGNNHFILNFQDCDFVDSTGLGVIVAIYKKCLEAKGNIQLKNINPQVMKLFVMTRLDKVFEILD